MILAAYWPLFGTGQAVHAAVVALRFLCLAAVAVLSLLWKKGTLSPPEVRWAKMLGAYLGLLVFASVTGVDVSRGLHNWLRVLPIYALAIAFARPLRHAATARAFGIALGIASFLSFLFTMAVYFYYAGPKLPGYETVREFKTTVQHASGIALNPLASATLLFGVLSLCLVRSGWTLRCLVGSIAIFGSIFTGSRAPLALAFVGLSAVWIAKLLWSRTLAVRSIAYITILFTAIGLVTAFIYVPPVVMSAATEGRYDVWTVGIEKFMERPLNGFGPESWRDDLTSRLPGYYKGTSGLAALRAGGYHSEFVTLLAEGGLICFLPALFLFGILFSEIRGIALNPRSDRFQGQALVFAFFLFFFRASVEVPGLFGYGEDVTDYLAAMFVAIVVSRASMLASSVPTPAVVRSASIALPPSANPVGVVARA